MLNHSSQKGFTLVEIMVVVVILSIFAGMMTFSVGGSESQRNMAFYEHLQSNISYVRLLSSEQMQPYGLAIKLAKADEPSQIMVVKLDNAFVESHEQTSEKQPAWQLENNISPLDIPKDIELNISPLDSYSINADMPNYLVGQQAPPVVWFGTGEATPVRIVLQKKNPNDSTFYPIGEPIVINSAGAIEITK